MEQTGTISVNKTQKYIETGIRIWALLIALYHIVTATFQYVVAWENITAAEQWVTLAFFVAVILYVFASLLASKESRARMIWILKKFCSIEQILLICLLAWFVLSCVMNERYGLFRTYLGDNRYLHFEDWYVYDTAVCFLILFPLARLLGRENFRQAINLLIHVVAVSYSVFTVVALWHILQLEVLEFPSGYMAGLGRSVQISLGMHPNLSGMIALTLFCLCICMIVTQKPIVKAAYTVMGLSQLAMVYWSNSRTVFLGALIFVVSVSFFVCRNKLKEGGPVRNGLIGLAAAAMAGIIFWYGREGAFILLEKITHINELLGYNASAQVKRWEAAALSAGVNSGYAPVLLDAEGTRGLDGIRKLTDISHRLDIWSTCFSLMFYKPFITWFGVTSYELPEALTRLPVNRYWNVVSHAHNAVIQVGVSMGVPAMLFLITFLLMIGWRSIRVLKKSLKTKNFAFLIPCTLLAYLAVNMAEAYLIDYFSVLASFFFLFCGWAVAMDREEKETK